MNNEVIDCVCFRLPKMDEIKPIFCRPGYLYLKVARTIGKGDCYISVRVQEKTEQDKQHKDFEAFFRQCGRFSNTPDAAVLQHDIGQHRLLLAIGSTKEPPQCTLVGAVDLDSNHYLHISATFSIAAECYPDSENAWQVEKLKRDEIEATLKYIWMLLENLQLTGNFAEVLRQVRAEEQQKQQAEQQKILQEKLAKAAEPIDCDYFGLPATESLIEVRIHPEQALLYFTRDNFSGEINIQLQRCADNAEEDNNEKWSFLNKLLPAKSDYNLKSKDFLQFFRSQVLPSIAGETLSIPIENISSGHHSGCLALHLTKAQELQWIAAIDLDDDHYLTFVATYQKTDGSFTEEDNPAAADIYRYVQSVFNTLHIKTAAINPDLPAMA